MRLAGQRYSRMSVSRLSAIALFAALVPAAFVFAWTGPSSAPPSGNVSAPINVGSANQVKDGGLGVGALAVFGNSVLSGMNRYLNFGTVPVIGGVASPQDGYGIRDNSGTLEFKNDGGAWASLQSIIFDLTGGGGGGGGASTTSSTMVPSWPDAFICNNGVGSVALYYVGPAAANMVYYRLIANTTAEANIYFTNAGAYAGQSGLANTDCVSSGWSISQLYSLGRAFHFIGGESEWKRNGASIYYSGAKVGIATTSPKYALDVNGDVNVSSGHCFRVDGACIGYTVKLAAIYATTTARNNVPVVFSGSPGSQPTYTGGSLVLPSNTSYIVVEMWGGGGGGAGVGTNGSFGGSSCFSRQTSTPAVAGSTPGCATESALVRAGGGEGASWTYGAGGSGINWAGSNADLGSVTIKGGTGQSMGPMGVSAGGSGGSAARGGGGGKGNWMSQGTRTTSEFGGGGSGAGSRSETGYYGPGGGGSNYAQERIDQPSGTYYYTIGAGGPGGSGDAYSLGKDGSSGAMVLYVYATSSPSVRGTDYAEMFPVSDPSIVAGDIVAIDQGEPVSLIRAEAGSDHALAGVIATEPGEILGDINAIGQRPLALAGRVPVKVNGEGGPIKIGDRIAPSSEPGVGKKALPSEDSVGIALESFQGASGSIRVFLDLQKESKASESDAPKRGILASLIGSLADWFADAGNGIREFFADRVKAKEVHTDIICMKRSDGSEFCVDGDALSTLVEGGKSE